MSGHHRSEQGGAVSEIWRPVIGYEGTYEVSNHGKVRSLDRAITDSWGRVRHLRGKLLSTKACSAPIYPAVRLSSGTSGVSEIVRVHTLMAAAFIGPRPPGREVRHLDDDKMNNTLTNLAYGTSSENSRDMVRNGHHNHASQTHCKHGHEYTPDNIYWCSGGRYRLCKICAKRRQRESRRRVAARKKAAI